MIRLLLITIVLAGALQARAHRFRVFPNKAIEILAIAEGPDGFLWLGAADGLYRFDGFRYRRIQECPLPSVYFLVRSPDGNLWAAGPSGLARYRDGRFRLITSDAILALGMAGGKLVGAQPRQLVTIASDGSRTPLINIKRNVMTIASPGQVWYGCPDSAKACSIEPGPPVDVPGEFEQFVRDARGRFWAAVKDRAVLIESGREVEELRRRPSQRTSRPAPLRPGRDGRVWFIGETIRELASGESFDDGGVHADYQATAGYEDSRGHLWVAKLDLGLVEWIPDGSWQRWNTGDFGGSSPVQVVRTRGGGVVTATTDNLYRLVSGGWKAFPAEPRDYAAILPLDDGGFLASVRKLGLLRLDSDGRVVERPPDPTGLPDSYRILIKDAPGHLWTGHKLGLYRIDNVNGALKLTRQNLPGDGGAVPDQAVDLEVDAKGRLWCGYQRGIAWLDDAGQWQRADSDKPVELVRSFAVGPEAIWVAHRAAWPFLRLARGEVKVFAADSGYLPVDTHFIKRDRRGWIWRGSTEGVHVFDGGSDTVPDRWLRIGRREGLAVDTTGQYGFFEDRDGSVWIAGEEGLSHIQPNISWFSAAEGAPPPRITHIEAGRVEVGTLDAPEFRANPLRHRLLPRFETWRGSSGALELGDLPRGEYTLEVAYAGSAGPVLRHAFQVGTGTAWWQSVALPLAGGASILLFARRTRSWQRAGYWISKSVFLARRRWRTRSGAEPSTAADHAGTTLFGRYQLLRPISRGGFSVVYEGRDLDSHGAKVAVKVLRADQPGNEGWVRDRFAQEVAALRSVRHDSVVPVLDSWVSLEGEPCLAMPLLDGPTLRHELDRGPLTPRSVAAMARQVGSGLAEVHRLGIVHRDLKPENLIRAGERWVIIDFGTAGLRAAGTALAATTLVSGSLAYMAPEQLTGHYSASSDVYAFGLLILESLTGKRLSQLQSISSDAKFTAELEAVIAPLIALHSARALANLLEQAYRPEPRRRPPDVNSWADEVAEILERSETVGHPA